MASSQDTVAADKGIPDVVASGMLPPSSKSSQASAPEEQQAYSIYTRNEKWFIVAIVAAAGLCSPLPANIYFPAIPVMAEAFSTSQEVINQTVTAYLVMQGASPMLWGPLADRFGRRPVYFACLTLLIGSSIGLALCPTNAFWLLIVLRLLQAGGCASTLALGAGVTGDITIPEERGGYYSLFNLGPMVAPCVGPAVGGALAENLGWRSTFWALVITAGFCVVMLYLFLPETLRRLAGNGSVSLGGIYRPLTQVVGRGKQRGPATRPSEKKQSINPFVILTYPDVAVTLIFTGVIYSVQYTILATISSAFADVYPWLSETLLGVSYLPTGLGMILGTYATGRLLDMEYARAKRKHVSGQFPKEVARLRTMPFHVLVFVVIVVGWGLCLGKAVHIAAPLVLSAIIGWCGMAILNTTMTLAIDVLQSRSSGATACINFVRCSMGAILVALSDRMVSRLGYIWTYVLLAALCACMIPLMYVEMLVGPKWRLKREKLDVT